METIMKRLLHILFLCFCIIHAQDYKITFLGLPAVDVNMAMDENKINFSVQTVGLINLIWPTENQYAVTYNSSHFGLLNYEKKIKQGTNKYKLTAKYYPEDSTLHYEQTTLKRVPEIQTIFTLLAQVQKEPIDAIDTKWFPMDHDGQLFSARLLWADTSTITIEDSSIICNHYRLDIKAEEDVTSLHEQSDYFMNNIVAPEAVRQLWIEKSGRRRIIQASVKIYGINIVAKIKNV
jgi:hypothetical protein